MKRLLKKGLPTILMYTLIALSLVLGIWLISRAVQLQRAEEDYRRAEELAFSVVTESTSDTTAPAPDTKAPPLDTEVTSKETETETAPIPDAVEETTLPEETTVNPVERIPGDGKTVEYQVNFAALWEVNRQVVGWILIPDTDLSYPLVQAKDNAYYLNRTWNERYSVAGSIFLDYRNSAKLDDFHSIIYGHRMMNGSMFHSLQYYKEEAYAEAHPYIYIITEEGTSQYQVFAAYEADAVGGSTYRLGLTDADGQQAYIDYCLKNSIIKTDATVAPGMQIITLSTCVSMDALYDTRWVVQAVKVTP